MNILLTGHSKWIWKYLYDKLNSDYNIFWFSRTNDFNLLKKETFEKIKENIWENELDVLILNAGIASFWNFEDNSLEDYENIINLNLLANIRLLKNLEKNITKNTKIIFIWSIISKKFMKWWSVYQASKFWLRWFAWWLKKEWKKVFIINPKIVDTWFHTWKVDINSNWEKTYIDDIYKVVENILIWKENRFEIDL